MKDLGLDLSEWGPEEKDWDSPKAHPQGQKTIWYG